MWGHSLYAAGIAISSVKTLAITICWVAISLGASLPARGQEQSPNIPNPGSEVKKTEITFSPDAAAQGDRKAEPIPLPPVDTPEADKQLTLAEAESMATEFHPAMREAEGWVRAARGNWVQVGLKPNPEIGYAGSEIGQEGTAGQQGGFFSQEFVTAGKLNLNRAVALREQAQAEQRVQQTRLQVITTVRKYYFETLAAEHAMALTRQLSEIASQSVVASQRRLERQDVPKTSLLQSQIESDSAAMMEQQSNERYAAARRRLATVLGTPDQEPAKLENIFDRPLPDLDFDTIRERIMSSSPELSELRFAVDRARWAVERASAGRSPNVNLQSGVQFDNATQSTITNVQLSMPLPIYDRNQGAVAQACGELAAAQAALQARELAIQERLAGAMRDYRTARERVTRYREKILPAAQETLTLINTGYQQGEIDYTQLFSVQQTYATKNLSYLQDLETAWVKWAEIDGYLLGDVATISIDQSRQSAENNEVRR
jgi:outer membrane protein, heavy metal efflux system